MASSPKKVLIEEWLPAAAIGVECMRERGSASALAPHTYLHVWWARRPLTASRAAVLASLLPADFPRDTFERLLGFWGSSRDLVKAQTYLDGLKGSGSRVANPHGTRAFRAQLSTADLAEARRAIHARWGADPLVLDPMAGGGSIPLEAARLGLRAVATEYNPVACSILEATVDYPFRFGVGAAASSRKWGDELRKRFVQRMELFFPTVGPHPPLTYIFARTVPCPDTGHETPLVPDWHLLKAEGKTASVVAEPVVDNERGTWTVRIRKIGRSAGQLREAPPPTYSNGKGISLFKPLQISADYIKSMAQQGKMGSALYAVALKTGDGLEFRPAQAEDLGALKEAERELARLRPAWERDGVLPTEEFPQRTSDDRPRTYGMPHWADMFTPRQLLGMGVLVEELRNLRPQILQAEGTELGEAVVHLLALGLDKFVNWNAILASWNAPWGTARSVFDKHDYAFKSAFCEMAPCGAGTGLAWATANVLDAYEEICKLPRHPEAKPVEVSLGSATSVPQIEDGSITAVVVDPPYADNVQYSELADFFYVWLKRTQGHRRPDWFATYLCDHDQEAVVNTARHRHDERIPTKVAREVAHEHYERLMADAFRECRRVLRDDGVLTVMFTHKKQEAWEALFNSLIRAGFTIAATWPVKTESEHSLHQARKNAAQSTVILVARKRPPEAGVGYLDADMLEEIRERARSTAARLKKEGLNPVDQLVGSFGPAMEVYSRFDQVRTDTGEPVGVGRAIDEASDAVSAWRIEELASRGLEGVEAEGRFVLLCWDVLGAAEFRFNEAKLLGHAAGMDVESLVRAGLVAKSGDKVKMLSARERRRDRALEPLEAEELRLEGNLKGKKGAKQAALKVHPNDPWFRTALDGCHALALRYAGAKGGAAGVGSAKALALQQGWNRQSAVARLLEALVLAAPPALWFDTGPKSMAAQFPEFRAWRELLQPVFGITPPEWKQQAPLQPELEDFQEEQGEEDTDGE